MIIGFARSSILWLSTIIFKLVKEENVCDLKSSIAPWR